MKKKNIHSIPSAKDFLNNSELVLLQPDGRMLDKISIDDFLHHFFSNYVTIRGNICPALSLFTRGDGWVFENGRLVGKNLPQYRNAESPSFEVVTGATYRVIAYATISKSSSVQAVTGGNQSTIALSNGLTIGQFTATDSSCIIRAYPSLTGGTDIQLSFLSVERL